LTISQVSVAAGIDPGNLSRIERGVQVPSRDVAERLAQQFVGVLTELQIIYPERYATPEDGADPEAASKQAA
jgi:transcriptional regulator with XRE-family HTH domain